MTTTFNNGASGWMSADSLENDPVLVPGIMGPRNMV